MAKKKEASKNVLEREYVIPLRRHVLGVPYYRKAKKAVIEIRLFIARHMKSENVSIGKYLNEHVWLHGMKNPPKKVKVTAVKDSEGKVTVELFGAPKEEKKKAVKEEAKKAAKETLSKEAEKLEKEIEDKKEHKAEEAKKVEHEEIKELRKEHPKHAPKMPQESQSQELRKKEMIPPQRKG
ncbi:60S ribosomal protein L31 [Candidatus Woesearchaeota archaeon]|nr:60S ribosomal protein L31 [Candidatus Woesearchaeota archaeon]